MNILVMGPHGSGMSSVVQILQACGFFCDAPPGQLPSACERSAEAKAGGWLQHFNDDMLWLFGADWRSASHLDVNTLPPWLHTWLAQRATAWTASMAEHGHWAGADPQLCLTASFWLRLFPATPIVLCLRHPQQTLAALMRLQPCPFPSSTEALAAWRRAFVGAVVTTAGQPCLSIDYDRLRLDPKGEVARLLAFCCAHLPHYTPPAALPEQLADRLTLDGQPLLAQSPSVLSCAAHDVEAHAALLAGDQERLARALQAFPQSPRRFDLDHTVPWQRQALATRERDVHDLETRLLALQTHLAEKDRRISHLEHQVQHLTQLQQMTADEARALQRSWAHRIGRVVIWPAARLKRVYRECRNGGGLWSEPLAQEPVVSQAELLARYEGLSTRPLFSIITPVYNTPAAVLRETLESVCQQVYQEWQLCLVDDASSRQETLDVLAEFCAREPQRITSTRLPGNSGIAVASNTAARLASGLFLAFLDHDDVLVPEALLEMALRLGRVPEADLLYSDEDKLTMAGKRVQPFYKPDFSPELLLTHNYLCHFSAVRTTVFWEVGGFHAGVDGSQDYDLFLRVTEVARRVEHIPKILYHWRMMPGSAAVDPAAKGGLWRESSRQALRAAAARRHWQAVVVDGLLPDTYRVKFTVAPTAPVTIIIPTKDKVDLLRTCIESIRQRTTHQAYEIVVISNNSTEEATYTYLASARQAGHLRFLRYDVPFNYAAINNFAVQHCDSPYLLFLNNDTEVISAEWLSSMLEFAQHAAIGAVGAKLLYPDNTVQHAGVILGIGGVAGHSHRRLPGDSPGYFSQLNVVRNYSAVTAACLLTRREVFDTVGGFNEDLRVAFNDVDFCLKVRQAGYRIVYTPYAALYHYESASRGSDEVPEQRARFHSERAYMLAHWGAWLYNDPYYNPHLTLRREDFSRATISDAAQRATFMRMLPLASSSH